MFTTDHRRESELIAILRPNEAQNPDYDNDRAGDWVDISVAPALWKKDLPENNEGRDGNCPPDLLSQWITSEARFSHDVCDCGYLQTRR